MSFSPPFSDFRHTILAHNFPEATRLRTNFGWDVLDGNYKLAQAGGRYLQAGAWIDDWAILHLVGVDTQAAAGALPSVMALDPDIQVRFVLRFSLACGSAPQALPGTRDAFQFWLIGPHSYNPISVCSSEDEENTMESNTTSVPLNDRSLTYFSTFPGFR